MPKIFPLIKKVTVSGSCPPTVTLLDDVGYKDTQALAIGQSDAVGMSDGQLWIPSHGDVVGMKDDLLVLDATPIVDDRVGLKDTFAWLPSMGDSVGGQDGMALVSTQGDSGGYQDLGFTLTPSHIDDFGLKDTHTLTVDEEAHFRAAGHGAAGDSDPWEDAWTDATVGQTGVNHGDQATLTAGGPDISAKTAYIEINFTRVTGFTSALGTHTFDFRIAHDQLTDQQMIHQVFFNAAKPFVESTVTNAAPPSLGTSVVGPTIMSGIPAGAATHQVITLTNAQMDDFIGKWMLVRFQGVSLNVATFTIDSRSSATAANRPRLHYTFQE